MHVLSWGVSMASTTLSRFMQAWAIVLLLCINTSSAQTNKSAVETVPPIGQVTFPVTCSSEARPRFERAVAMLHHMMYAQAEREFRSLAASDPDCAMAYWGIAMTLFHPLWPGEPTKVELQQGSDAIEKARALKPSTEREKAYITATSAYYNNWQQKSHRERVSTWDVAQRSVYPNYREDIDAAAFYALALLATAPKADKSYAHQKEAGALLENLYARYPEHPGVVHYLIHAYDNPELAGRAVDTARAYDKIAPDVPHALHMPTHIFTRLGIWSDSIDWNIRSANAALKYPVNNYISHHYLHALDYLIYAYLQSAEDVKANEVLNQMYERDNYQQTFVTGYALAALPARYTLERRKWEDAAKLEIPTRDTFPWEDYPEVEAIIHYARGLGAARSGNVTTAHEALSALNAIHKRLINTGQQYWGILVDAQRKTVAAWIDYSEGNNDSALVKMREAADLEDSVDKNPVTPGSVLPAWELLGEMLLLSGDPEGALVAYEASLSISPYRFNSLYGAGHAAERMGNTEMARSYYDSLLEVSVRADSPRPEIDRAKSYTANNRIAETG